MSELVDNYVKLLYHFDGVDGAGQDIDYSGFNHIPTFNGNAQLDTAQKVFGATSVLFDGTGDYLSIPTSTDFDFGTADFTIDFRVRFNALGNYGLIAKPNIDGSIGWRVFFNNDSSILDFRGDNGAGTENAPWSPGTATWYHVAIVRDVNTLRFFIDGTSIGTDDITGWTNDGGTDDLFIGRADNVGSTFDLNGWIDEMRISKGVARWTANFTPPPYEYHRIARIQSL